jgi:hypothetical protein
MKKTTIVLLAICAMHTSTLLAQTKKPAEKKASTTKSKDADGIDGRMKGPKGEKVMIGEKGGRYYINEAGNKVYVEYKGNTKEGKKTPAKKK